MRHDCGDYQYIPCGWSETHRDTDDVCVHMYGASGERNETYESIQIECGESSGSSSSTKNTHTIHDEPKETNIEMHALDFSLISAVVDNGTNIQYDRFLFSSKFNSFIGVSGAPLKSVQMESVVCFFSCVLYLHCVCKLSSLSCISKCRCCVCVFFKDFNSFFDVCVLLFIFFFAQVFASADSKRSTYGIHKIHRLYYHYHQQHRKI